MEPASNAGLIESHDTTTLITKTSVCLPGLKQSTARVPNVQQQQLLGKLETSTSVQSAGGRNTGPHST